MAGTVLENAAKVLSFLYTAKPRQQLRGPAIAEGTGLQPSEINDAVTILVDNGYAEMQRFLGTAPWTFGYVYITARGRVEYERISTAAAASEPAMKKPTAEGEKPSFAIVLPPIPIGSPYGFGDQDWELVADRKGKQNTLNVVLGYQFASAHYNSELLAANVECTLANAVAAYNALPSALPVTLNFRTLSAGYGEHLFNEIARDIIATDIAVFDTSDLNANVMIELGVALTWGIRVLVIKNEECTRPPSDISGHTWVDYRDSAATFIDPDHIDKLTRMVERAVRKKAHR